jgi:hypothetical protein
VNTSTSRIPNSLLDTSCILATVLQIEDEVLVEILKKEGQNEYIHRWGKRIQTELNTYGKVIGVFERKRYDKIPGFNTSIGQF